MRDVPDYLFRTAHVFDELRLVYAPVPKAGSTAILGALAEVVGLAPADLARSRKLEATRALTVHDGSVWGESYRLEGRPQAEVATILGSDEWYRFTVVREPAGRVWSAWVSKVLVRDPRFVSVFGEDWFPAVPSTARDVLDSFRRFVVSLRDADRTDAHWQPQASLVGLPTIVYRHTGRVEEIDRTVTLLGEYLESRGRRLPLLRHENRAILPFTPALFDAPARSACDLWTAPDREAFGYPPLDDAFDDPPGEWFVTVDASIAALQAVIERNERIGDQHRLLAEDADELHRLRH